MQAHSLVFFTVPKWHPRPSSSLPSSWSSPRSQRGRQPGTARMWIGFDWYPTFANFPIISSHIFSHTFTNVLFQHYFTSNFSRLQLNNAWMIGSASSALFSLWPFLAPVACPVPRVPSRRSSRTTTLIGRRRRNGPIQIFVRWLDSVISSSLHCDLSRAVWFEQW